jgi:hypothetical protein
MGTESWDGNCKTSEITHYGSMPAADMKELAEALQKAFPDQEIPIDLVAMRADFLQDLFEQWANPHALKFREAMGLNGLTTLVSKTVKVNHWLSTEGMFEEMDEATSQRVRGWRRQSGETVWYPYTREAALWWADQYKPDRPWGKQRTKYEVSTLRCNANLSGTRLLREMNHRGVDFAGFEHWTAYLRDYAKPGVEMRPVMITRRELVDKYNAPLCQLIFEWVGTDRAHVRITKRPEDERLRTRYCSSDLLVVHKE